MRFEGWRHGAPDLAAAQIAMRVIEAAAPVSALAIGDGASFVALAACRPRPPPRAPWGVRGGHLADRLADATEPPLARLEARDGLVEIVRLEVGPEHVREVELRVREPIEEEVRNPALASGANDEVGVADGEARHPRVEALGRHFVRIDPPGANLLRELARRGRDLLPPSIGERERERHLVAVLARVAERVEHRSNERREAAEVADRVQADPVVEELLFLGEEKLAQKHHEGVDLFVRPSPVLLAEGVERERLQPEAPRRADDAPDRGRSFLVPSNAREPAVLRPTAVAVHDDADVRGEIASFDEDHAGTGRLWGKG